MNALRKSTIPSVRRTQSSPPTAEKLRGGYYTPLPISTWLCAWAIRSKHDRLLEPSAGDGSFLVAAADTFLKRKASAEAIANQLTAVELSKAEAEKASLRLNTHLGVPVPVISADFFTWHANATGQLFHCVVGNPPFIRYQNFPEPSRSLAMSLMARCGLKANRLTNIWVPFVVGATTLLTEGGRLAMVIPAELLQVTYAGQLRSFLVDSFRSIDMFTCNELFFPGAQQEVVLLLADHCLQKRSPKNKCLINLSETTSVEQLLLTSLQETGKRSSKLVQHGTEKWLKYLLSSREISLMRKLREASEIATLRDHAEIDVGIVTGENGFFVMTQAEAEERGLLDYLLPLVSRSSHLKGAKLIKKEWEFMLAAGERVCLFYVGQQVNGSLSRKAKAYIGEGERRHIHTGYKCSIREPWYSVPAVWPPDCFFFRQIYDFPRAVANDAKAVSTDTIHRMTCKSPPHLLVPNLYTHLTAASAEIEGRSYGGGVLELEPTEAERLLVPGRLNAGVALDAADSLVRAGRLKELLEINDRSILQDTVGLDEKECRMLRAIWVKLRERRLSRRRRSSG